jgi:Protein of unknown function (DUF1569)
MVPRNLFDPAVKQEIISRIEKLTPASVPLWGKMNVSQMLAHLELPVGVALGSHKLRRTLMGRIFGPMVKSMLYNEKPFKRSMPTDPSFVTFGQEKDFYKEKQVLLDMVGNFSETSMVDEPHPFFGPLTKEQWSKGMYKHIDHHLRQFGV